MELTYILLLVLGVAIVLSCVGRYAFQRKKDLLDPFFASSAFFAILFVLRSVSDIAFGSAFIPPGSLQGRTLIAFNWALLCALVTYIVFVASYCAGIGSQLANVGPNLCTKWRSSKIGVAMSLMLVIGLVATGTLVERLGGLRAYLTSKASTLTATGTGYLELGTNLLSLAAIVAASHWLSTGRGRGWLLFSLPIALAFGLASGSKTNFFLPLVGFIVAYHYLVKRIRLIHIIGLGLLIVIASPIFNVYRHADEIGVVREAIVRQEILTNPELVAQGFLRRFYGVDSLTYIIRDTPSVMEFAWGATMLPVFVAWVPRDLWEGKPTVSFSRVFGETYFGEVFGGTGTAASPTMLGEAYLNFHFGGLIVLGAVCGVLLRGGHRLLIGERRTPTGVAAYAFLLPFFIGFWEGGIGPTLVRILANAIVVWVVIRLAGDFSKA